jgi:hypothetical protein
MNFYCEVGLNIIILYYSKTCPDLGQSSKNKLLHHFFLSKQSHLNFLFKKLTWVIKNFYREGRA